jgi:hypothetical protein
MYSDAVLSHRQAVLLTGGEDAQGNAVFDPQLLDTSSGSSGPWHWCSVVGNINQPSPRAGHTMTGIPGMPDSFLLFGGNNNGEYLDDLHRAEVGRAAAAWDKPCKECDDTCEAATVNWMPESPSGSSPSPRSGHSATIYEGSLVIVGGENASGLLGDCHVLDIHGMCWSTMAPSLPFPLSNHCAVALPGIVSSFCFSEPTLFIFGGRTGVISTHLIITLSLPPLVY